MIGTELLLGQIVDTNASYIGRVLAENGINLYQKTSVGDNPERIKQALDAALTRSDVVLTSGGLGPTEDDITRECIAELLGRPLEFRQDLYEHVSACFAAFRRPMTENNKRQAHAPQGAKSIHNPNGTAPGLIVEDARGVIICMPGVPKELYPMLTDSVLPYVREKFGISGVIHSRVLKVCGVGESAIDDKIGHLIKNEQNPTVGVLASLDAVRVRITARAEDLDTANAIIDPLDAQVRELLPGLIMGVDDDTLEGVVNGLLSEKGWTLAVVETNTGGALVQRLTAVKANCFAGGMVLPLSKVAGSNAKMIAHAYADKVRADQGASCGLALIANPAAKTTAVVFVTPEDSYEWEMTHYGTDERGQVRGSVVALEQVRRWLAGVLE
ncbi:MAG: CinA family nicotinamide mononucleotide deamidase-related protein [Candidatus Hydrogenedentes bacterium]|nr:CinA family nicotinamide mononucleotide deamidase-related protein [Candidatus Hydrogenedentota bacterium]